jgi:sugar lactone lactonase YvrE
MDIRPQSILSVGAMLGEGPIWVAREKALWFVDIKGHRIHRFDPAAGAAQSWETPAQPGWIVPTHDGLFAVGMKTGIHGFDPARAAFTLLFAPESELTGNRLNDAVVDPRGRLWFGSMDDDEQADTGRVYRLYRGVCEECGLAPASIVNGPAVSPEGDILYHVDTLGRTLWRSTVDAGGDLVETSLFARIEDGAGYPDGPAVDAEGCVWIGLFGGWAARRYDPDGALMQTIAFPVANVTKIAFGGEDLSIAYATTARKGLNEREVAQQPLAGDLFKFEPGVRGLSGAVAIIS